MNKRLTGIHAALAAGLCLIAGLPRPLYAQAVPTPGQVREQLRAPQRPAPTPDTSVAPTRPSPTAVAPGGKAVLVTGFEITGNRAIPTAELQEVLTGFTGRPLTLAEIYDAADALTRHYRTQGYTLASAYVPEQKIGGGIIRLEMLEGTLGQIRAEGTGRTRPEFLAWQFDRIKPGEVLRDAPLEHEMLLLNDLPGLDAKAIVRPGSEFGTSDLVLATTEKFIDGDVRLNNYGRETIGEWRAEGNLGLNGLAGIGDRLEFNAVYAEGDLLHYGRIAYSATVSPAGTRSSIYFSSFDYEVNSNKLPANLQLLEIDGEGDNYGFRIDHPFWRSRNRNLTFGIGIDRTLTRQYDRLFQTEDSQHLTLGSFSAQFSYLAGDNSFSTLGATLSTNFNAADRELNPQTGFLEVENNAQTAKLQIDMSHYRTLYRRLAMSATFTGVASVDPLMDLERFRLGGPNSVRAYAPAELAGDEGFVLRTELIHPLPYITFAPTYVKAFFDTGRVYNKNHNLLGVEEAQSLSGAGFALQTSVYQRLFVDVTLAQPIGAFDTSDTDRGVRLWANISANF